MDHRRYDLMEVGRYKFNKKLDFVERARGNYLAEDYVITEKHDKYIDQEKVVLKKGTLVDEEVAELLSKNRTDFRRVLTLENELISEEDPCITQYINSHLIVMTRITKRAKHLR